MTLSAVDTHVMLDLETFGRAPGCSVRSIGAIAFTLDGVYRGDFYRNVQRLDCAALGLTEEPETVQWWSEQSTSARVLLEESPVTLRDAARDFKEWWGVVGPVAVWSHGAAFDVPIWQVAAARAGVSVPWPYKAIRDTRTLYDVAGLDTSTVPAIPGSVTHYAIDDARWQIRCVARAWEMLRDARRIGGWAR